MNPFDLRGPPFLVFYLMVSLLGLGYLYLQSRGFMSTSPRLPSGDARRSLRDPYLLACLRGGMDQMLQTVAFSLHERKLLSYAGEYFGALGNKDAWRAVTNPLEQALLRQCGSIKQVSQLRSDPDLVAAMESYAEPLRQAGLLADADERRRRVLPTIVVVGALVAISVTKIQLAIQRGHSNLAFLVMLTFIAVFVATMIYRRRRTGAGDRALRDQQTLFARLKNRVNRLATNGATNEAVLVAAAFGFGVLPDSASPFVAQIRRQTDSISSSTWSSCGSSGGSSCGGGGGGCGGCGGG